MASGQRNVRLDESLVERGLVETRARARNLILAGQVRSGTAVLDKPGKRIREDLPLEVIRPPRYVGRGGDKLAAFLERFAVPLDGIRALDIGASTGGFTDCLLQAGAAHVTCVDVGYGQLHYTLRTDPRVANLERTNARNLKPGALPHALYDIVVMDLSFISLRKVLPAAWRFLKPGGHLIALVKPQFEAERAEADKGRGVIRDPAVHERIMGEIREFARTNLPQSRELGWILSPITGADGNREFLLGWRREGDGGTGA